MKLKNLKLSDLTTVLLACCGMISSIEWLDVPFWVYLVLLTVYAGLRLANKDNTEIKDV